MEEAVTRRYVHEESSAVTQLCAAVEACLSQGLKRRVLGLFKTSSTTALLHKIAKYCPEAEYISKIVRELENNDSSKRSSSSSESFNRPPLLKKNSSTSISSTMSSSCSSSSLMSMKYLWIRLALYEKRLVMIVEYLVANASSYYEKDSVVADNDYGCTLSSLLAGLSTLEFTKAKRADYCWTDSHADGLVHRYRISEGRRSSLVSSRPPIINFKRSLNTGTDEANALTFKSLASCSVAKDYVESLHQNSRAILLYGKNNVQVLQKNCKEHMMGYVSLHRHIQSLTIEWTPNQLMNNHQDADIDLDKERYWAYALNINVDDIVYVHCHQNKCEDNGGTIILVSHDGLQCPPIIFPEGGHIQQFLSCLETGLLPNGQLDPPLWSQRGLGKFISWPKCVRKRILPSVIESFDDGPEDYVFRIVSKSKHEEFVATHSVLDFVRSAPRRAQLNSSSTTGSSNCSSKSISIDQYSVESPMSFNHQNASIEMACSTMRRQIISRAFYGWLAYCRHLSTVRTHLSGLVHERITPEIKLDEDGLTLEKWKQLNLKNGVVDNATEVFRLVYYGGVNPELRKDVWPYLLGHYGFGTSLEQRQQQDETCRHFYETVMSEWLAVEAIVQQKEKEKTARAVAKLSFESNGAQKKTIKAVRDLNIGDLDNEVFADISDLPNREDLVCDVEEQQAQQERQRQQRQSLLLSQNEILPAACNDYLTVESIPRAMKTSTDSGHVEEDLNVEPEEEEEKDNKLINGKNINKYREGNFFKSFDELSYVNVGTKSTPSISSHDIVGNGYQIVKNTLPMQMLESKYVDNKKVVSPEYLSGDDVLQQFEEDEGGDNDSDGNGGEKKDSIELTEFVVKRQADVIITKPSIDILQWERTSTEESKPMASLFQPNITRIDLLQEPESPCISSGSSNAGVYSSELLEKFGLNMHRIEKDVQRCDRSYWYFANENLDKLRNIISTYVWEHLDVGYMQGMCDLVAPLLVIFDEECLAYSCFCKLMERMVENFPNGDAMDLHFVNMRSLIQILDPEMYDMMNSNGDYTHFYFCYRWFLLDFKRELVYDDVFSTWEIIWAAKHVASSHFVLFLALALLETYRDIILSNSMDFTDVIKFFNEMAERHNAAEVLQLARNLVLQLQIIIENK
uniref:Rab-GAP TBC domain-containing protein n=1 Tax=Glossina austeni TaxID=7395 RepID=A0A1A9UGI2_GLOAU